MQTSYLVPLAEPPVGTRMTFVTVMNFVMRNVRFMIVCGLVLAVLSPLPLIGREPKYTASTRFITEAERPTGRFLGDLQLPGTAGRGPELYIELLRSPVVLEGLVKTPLELEPGKPPRTLVEHYAGQPPTNEEAVRNVALSLIPKINAGPAPTGVVTLRVTAEDPNVAYAMVRELLNQADAFNEQKLRSQARREREFAQERLVIVERELREAEAEWLAFGARNRIVGSAALQLQQQALNDTLGRKRSLASMFVQAIERSRLDEVREVPRVVVLAPPIRPGSPSHISWQRVALVGLFAGMILGGLIALVREYFRSVSRQPTPEAQEFAALRAASGEQFGRPLRALVSAVRRPKSGQLQ